MRYENEAQIKRFIITSLKIAIFLWAGSFINAIDVWFAFHIEISPKQYSSMQTNYSWAELMYQAFPFEVCGLIRIFPFDVSLSRFRKIFRLEVKRKRLSIVEWRNKVSEFKKTQGPTTWNLHQKEKNTWYWPKHPVSKIFAAYIEPNIVFFASVVYLTSVKSTVSSA